MSRHKLAPIPWTDKFAMSKDLKRRGEVRMNVIFPKPSVEKEYRKDLVNDSVKFQEFLERSLRPFLERMESAFLRDALEDDIDDFFKPLFAAAAKNINISDIQDIFRSANTDNRRKFYSFFNDAIGIDISKIVREEDIGVILSERAKQNAALIVTLREDQVTAVRKIVSEGVLKKSSSTSMIEQIQELGVKSARRAELLARDQTTKLNAALSETRATNLGIEEYIWRTAGDDRVRETHAANNGKRFRYDDPPDTGNPGEEPLCRCIAQPIVDTKKLFN